MAFYHIKPYDIGDSNAAQAKRLARANRWDGLPPGAVAIRLRLEQSIEALENQVRLLRIIRNDLDGFGPELDTRTPPDRR